MTDTRKVTLQTEVDATSAEGGFAKVTQGARKMAGEVGAAGAQAAAGVEGIGAGADAAGAKVDRNTRSIVASIERATAAAQAGERGTASYFEALGRQRGANLDTLRPYIEQLRAAEAGSRSAAAAVDTIGVSAAQTAAALRQVPAQFTDIFTSLAAGQNPLQVLLQQGGQLKDSFGGAGLAAQALGRYVVGLVTPFTLLGGAVAAVVAGFALGTAENDAFVRSLTLSGNQAGTTALQLNAAAEAVAKLSGGTQRRAAEVLADIAGSGVLAASSLVRLTSAAVQLERAGGPAAEDTAKAFASLAKDPLAAALKLNEATGFLTRSTYEQIRALDEQGKTVDAARVAQNAYADAIEQRAPQILAQLGFFARAWQSVKDATAGAVDALAAVGRPSDTLQKEIDAIGARIAANNADAARGSQIAREAAERGNAILTLRLRLLQQGQAFEAQSAAYEALTQRQIQARAEFDKQGLQYLDARAKAEREIAQIRELGLRAGATEAEIEKRIAEFRAKAGSSDNKAAARELEQQASLLNQLAGLTSSYAQDIGRLNAARASGLVNEARYGELVRELVARQPFAKKAAEEQAKALKEEADATEAATKERQKYLDSLTKEVDEGARTLDKLREELLLLTQGEAAVRERGLLRLQERIEAEKLNLAIALARDLDTQAADAIRERIRQLEEELQLRRDIGVAKDEEKVRRDSARAAEASLREWERANEQIAQSLTDAIMRGGKSAGEYLRDYFRTLVLRPIVQAIVAPLAGTLSGLLGGSTQGGTAQGGGSPLGLLSSIGSLTGSGGLLGGLGAAGSAFQIGGQLSTLGGLQGTIEALRGAGALITNGSVRTGIAQGAGALAPYLAAFSAGRGVGQLVANGFAVGGSGNTPINAGAIIGAIVGGPLGSGIGAAIGGVVNRVFGRRAPEVRGQGIEATFTGGDASGNTFRDIFQRGGLFRSDRSFTERNPLTQEVEAALDAGARAVAEQARAYGEALGLPVSQLSGVVTRARITFTGNAEADEKAINEALASYGNALAQGFAPLLEPFRRAGEEIGDTLVRLGVLRGFSAELNALGGIFSRVASLSVDARESLIAMAGGMDALAQQAQNFVQGYYSRDEIAGLKARDLVNVFRDLGLDPNISTRDQFRQQVEALDVSTQAGQQALVALLGVANEFGTIADFLAETGGTLASAADQAPLIPALERLINPNAAQQQISAINSVTEAVNRVEQAIRQGQGQASSEPAPLFSFEVNGGVIADVGGA